MNQDLHNPAAISLALVGPHHKLLSTEDLDKPLPEGAEFWSEHYNEWVAKNLDWPNVALTYRIPLTLSDRLRSDRDRAHEEVTRISELIRVVEAVEKGAEWEHNVDESKSWYAPGNQSISHLEYALGRGRKIRLKPLPPPPQTIPWTLESHPDVVLLTHRQDKSHRLITRWYIDGVYVDGHGLVTYERLHSDWLQRNGDPCGT